MPLMALETAFCKPHNDVVWPNQFKRFETGLSAIVKGAFEAIFESKYAARNFSCTWQTERAVSIKCP